MTLAIVTATLDWNRALACVTSWRERAAGPVGLYTVHQGMGNADWVRKDGAYLYMTREIVGVVPAFNIGVTRALHDGADIIACLHDDLLIEQDRWDETVIQLFKACPRAGLCGFGGAKGLGADDLYKVPYQPMQLARQGFRSNMHHAEAHGIRSEVAEPVACLDGFSQIGTRDFWEGLPCVNGPVRRVQGYKAEPLFQIMEDWGVVHHFYDGMLGCFAKRLGYMTWFLPVACHHFGGVTAVADPRYHAWADAATRGLNVDATTGDQHFWTQAHQIGYYQFRDVLPIRV